MNLTLVDKHGNRIECECTFAQRFTSLPGGSKQVVLTFEDSQTAKEVFYFVWVKAMGRRISWSNWLKDQQRTKETSRPAQLPVGN
jgi:hypothetical protein